MEMNMTLKELDALVATRNMNGIRRKLRKFGYRDCEYDKRYRDISLKIIYNGNSEETETYTTIDGNWQFYGNIYLDIKGYENLEFIEIAMNKIYRDRDMSFPYRVYIYAKEK